MNDSIDEDVIKMDTRERIEPNPGFDKNITVEQANSWLKGLGGEFADIAGRFVGKFSGSSIYGFNKKDFEDSIPWIDPLLVTAFLKVVHPESMIFCLTCYVLSIIVCVVIMIALNLCSCCLFICMS